MAKTRIIKDFTQIVREKYIGFLITAIGLTVGFLWRDLIKAFIDQIVPNTQDLFMQTVITVGISFFLVIIVYILQKANGTSLES